MTNTFVATVGQEREEMAGRQPYRLWLAPDVASRLGRYISPIVAKVRTAFDARRQTRGTDEADTLTIDMSDAPNVPSAQLILLVNLLRHALGNGVEITLFGVKPTILGAFVTFDLPRDVVLIDSRGRRWAS